MFQLRLISLKVGGGAVGWDTALWAGRSRVWFPAVSFGIFLIDLILLAALWSWGELNFWEKWVSGLSPEG